MNIDRLTDMANRIAVFYASMPDQAQACLDVATHLRRFWDPRMRLQLCQHLDAHGADTLHPLAARALREHREVVVGGLTPSSAGPPVPPSG